VTIQKAARPEDFFNEIGAQLTASAMNSNRRCAGISGPLKSPAADTLAGARRCP